MERKEIVNLIKEKSRYLYITRDQSILEEQISLLRETEEAVTKTKEKYISEQNEEQANLWLSLECMVKVLINGLTMFVLLKKGDPDNAWNSLIEAQNNAHWSIIANEFDRALQQAYLDHFNQLEKWLFPPQTFVSSSMIVERSECSICKKDMLECNHIRGQCYMGQICGETVTKIKQFNHLAIVSNPADKRCRNTHVGNTNPPKQNLMTLKNEE